LVLDGTGGCAHHPKHGTNVYQLIFEDCFS